MNLAYAMLVDRGAAGPPLPGSLNVNRRLDQWLRVSAEGHVEVFSGKVELGQGILTALAQIVAEELDVALSRVRMVAASTDRSPDEAVTSGSLSVQESGTALRHACAQARAIYLEVAATRLGAPAGRLIVEDGTICGPEGSTTSYWALADDALLDIEASGAAVPKPASAYGIVGASAARLDLADKVFGRRRFIHDLDLPDMLHGRVLRPPHCSARLIGFEAAGVAACEGVVAIPRDGSMLGVLAATERQAERALAALAQAAAWDQPQLVLPDERALPDWLRAQQAERTLTAGEKRPAPASVPAPVRTMRASFAKPFMAHASIGPSCALARLADGGLEVWSHTQGIFNLRTDLARAFGLLVDSVVVRHVEGAGCYGHNGADDAAYDAAWLARAAGGRAVRVQWSRADELAWPPFGPAMAVDLEADLDADGGVAAWRHTVWSNGHSSRPGRQASPTLLGGWYGEAPFPRLAAINAPLAAGGGGERNAAPSYAFPDWKVVSNRVLAMPLRSSAMRALGAFANVFAAECFMDELALATGSDPVAFRLRHLDDPRARAVIAAVVEASGWRTTPLAEARGFGLGFARYKNTGAYCAVVAEIEAADEIRVRRLTIAADVGLVVNPDGVANQLEGGAVQATSWALKEAVRFDHERVTSDSWDAYPILRFSEVPAVDVRVVASASASVGAGECSMGPTAAAIGNAVGHALGVRVRELPLTRERILAAMD